MLEAQKFESYIEYAVWLTDQPEKSTGLQMLMKQVETALVNRMRGEPVEKIQKTVRDSVRDTAFLFFLHFQITQHFDYESRSIALTGPLLLERASNALLRLHTVPASEDQASDWREDLTSHATEIFTLKAATEQLAKRYFEGNQVLWRDSVEQLDNSIQLLNLIFDKRMDAFYFRDSSSRPAKKQHLSDPEESRPHFDFDLEALKNSIDAGYLVKSLVGLAYADTLSFMGDRSAAARLVASLLRNRRDAASTLTRRLADL